MAIVLSCWLLSGGAAAGWAVPVERVSVLMPAPFADATADLVGEFNRSHPQLQIAVSRGPLDTEALSDLAISSLLLGDAPYDLLLMDVTWTPKYAAAGWLQPLEPLLGAEALKGMAPGAQLGNAFDGHLWRIPLLADIGLLYWRTDLLEQPPSTPQQLEREARRLQQSGAVPWGYVWQGRQYEGLSCVFLEVLRGFGGDWMAGQHPQLDSVPAQEAAAWLAGLVQSGITPKAVANMNESEALQLFAAGDAAFMRNWPYAWQQLQAPDSAVRGKVGVTTVVAEAGRPGAGTQGSWGFSLLQGSGASPEAVATVLQWFTGEATARELAIRYGYTPAWESLLADPALAQTLPLLPVLRTALQTTALRPLSPLYAQLSDTLQRQLSGLITDQQGPSQAMAHAQRDSSLIVRAAGGQP